MEGLKSGHWSKTEDAALKQIISDYLENRDGLTLEQLIKQKDHKTSGSGSAPWLDIAESFPLRHVRSVYYRAQRLMNDDNYKGRQAFTAADKEKLKRVVQDVGEKWSLVGIQMGRLGDTVRRQGGREAHTHTHTHTANDTERRRARGAHTHTHMHIHMHMHMHMYMYMREPTTPPGKRSTRSPVAPCPARLLLVFLLSLPPHSRCSPPCPPYSAARTTKT
jgi:hypothetical protein